jgi:TPR repeat protein
MRTLWKIAASALAIGALIFYLRSAAVLADPLSDAVGAYSEFDYATAFPLFQKLANEKNPEARFWLGSMYFLGRGTPLDTEKGLELIRSAANAGVTRAQVLMGYIYENGYGVTADPVEAMTWYTIAASYVWSEDAKLVAGQAEARANAVSLTLPHEQADQATSRARAWKPVPLEDMVNP